MSRSRRKKKSLLFTLLAWGVAGALMGWGLWQAREFRRVLMVEVEVGNSTESVASTTVGGGTYGGDAEITAAGYSGDRGATILLVGPAEPAPDLFAGMAAEELEAKGASLLESGEIVEGRTMLNAALAKVNDGPQADKLRGDLALLNGSIFLGTAVLPDDPAAGLTEIQPGDSFLKMGRQFAVPAAYLEAINPSLNARNLKPLAGVKIVEGPFRLVMVKHARRMDLYVRDLYVRSYAAELEEGNYLPRGEYQVSPGSKIQVESRVWVGFEGIEPGTMDVSSAWIYGSGGPRRNDAQGRAAQMTGIKVADGDLWQIYHVVVETQSLLRVDP